MYKDDDDDILTINKRSRTISWITEYLNKIKYGGLLSLCYGDGDNIGAAILSVFLMIIQNKYHHYQEGRRQNKKRKKKNNK